MVDHRVGKLSVSLVLLASIGMVWAPTGRADSETAALTAAVQARDIIVERLQGLQTQQVFKETVTATVKDGLNALLRSRNDQAYGQIMTQEWQTEGVTALATLSTDFEPAPAASLYEPMGLMGFAPDAARDLGDHAPLFKFLGKLYDGLRDRMGNAFIRQGLIGDAYTVTYALPVVFTPRKGQWKQEYAANKQWIEYRRHFIPLTGIATYYAADLACKHFGAQYGVPAQICGMAADKLKTLMGRYVTPKISDFTFNLANGKKHPWNVTREDLIVVDAQSLKKELP